MPFHVHKRLVIVVSAILVAVLLGLCLALIYMYRTVDPARVITKDRVSELVRGPTSLGPADVGAVEPWMTFEYVNQAFGLPSDYLKSALSIGDARYPHLVLSRYAEERGMTAADLSAAVENALTAYFAASNAAPR